MNRLMTVEEAGKYLKVSPRTIYNLAKKGELPVVRVGESLRFHNGDIDRELQMKQAATEYFLVVDDQPTVCELLKRTLEKPGRVVIAVNSGMEAVEQLKEIKFNCILLDLVMPDMDGVKLLEHIRKIDKDVPVIAVTGHPDSPLSAQAVELGVAGVVTKPFSPQDVLLAIKS
jgi:excisionase family DNA binding protein